MDKQRMEEKAKEYSHAKYSSELERLCAIDDHKAGYTEGYADREIEKTDCCVENELLARHWERKNADAEQRVKVLTEALLDEIRNMQYHGIEPSEATLEALKAVKHE